MKLIPNNDVKNVKYHTKLQLRHTSNPKKSEQSTVQKRDQCDSVILNEEPHIQSSVMQNFPGTHLSAGRLEVW